ncbi:salicylate synthase [Ethanoligenens harbinense]|uniref:Salicylate synthase n=1 Tax=Ethanoligenens harbinense (strain DSM 18485 / JCM 12961 / CGMCC 1.5033 / YUAN-3) TaxID=663278 RepID=E6U9S7_ETHHY|nr:salicylate synthase [Ethanoligenens harbinense]ADU26193.1 salicylate synthase [Ethanoligenens harbinense YUAN-3]AVQ95330.1 salicylate synthase [Ethanoligenens harbinense YUAN-3]AYF37995.1 salicylate synthase [Ethanoligenens harbinense]AYF40741.1 salicylate synthase [Ethanoligenens harbinense]QCN91573.1 salicylate synthase [Ethanoligenens harbinense]
MSNENTSFNYKCQVKNMAENPYILAAVICQSHNQSNYILYENGNKISIGIGIHAEISVTDEYVTLFSADGKKLYETGVLSDTLQNVCIYAGQDGWRFYGVCNFGLARHNYHVPLGNESKALIRLFLPEIEYELNVDKLEIKTHSEEELLKEKETLAYIIKDYENLLINIKSSNVSLLDDNQLLDKNAEYYKNIVRECIKEIQNNKYQKAIMSRKISIDSRLNMPLSYVYGRIANNPERSYLISWDQMQVLGFSPETVVEVNSNSIVSTFPLAGTRALVKDDYEMNQKLERELLCDPKEIAEHAISVKLAFEELNRVCIPGSVAVSKYMSVIKRGTVQHLGSRLVGHLKNGCNAWHALNMLFPAVTASGIPKLEAIEAIGRLENDPRNLYSGCVLTYDITGTMDAALVLRTVFQTVDDTWLRAGAGIVEMSNPERELEETCEKLRSVTKWLVTDSGVI